MQTEITTKSMPEILVERMNATRRERVELMKSAMKCSFMEESMEGMLREYGFSVVLTADGYALGASV